MSPASVEVWEKHLERMKALPDNEPLRDLAIEDAQQVIERKRREILASS
jgi:hypothetical protein